MGGLTLALEKDGRAEKREEEEEKMMRETRKMCVQEYGIGF